MRRLITFVCADETLVGTLDEGPRNAGLLIVSGGNEIRAGAHRGMARLAQAVAARGYPVFRFDRRGVGDSNGANTGYAGSAPDIATAASTFVSETGIRHLIAFGNCDAATALALYHTAGGIDALVLANPWLGDQEDDLPPTAAIRARYAERLRNPATWRRLLVGGVDLRKFFKGLGKLARAKHDDDEGPANRMAAALAASRVPTEFVLTERDATAIAFAAAWSARPSAAPIHRIASASHSFAAPGDLAALEAILLATLERQVDP